MTWFAVYENATGRLVSLGTVVADDVTLARKGYAKKALTFDPRVPTKQWNETTRDFDDVPEPKPRLPLREFLDRFTVAEREDIFDAAQNGTAGQQKKIGAFLDYLKASEVADLGAPYIIDSVTAMETTGLLGVGRAAEILNA